jgi:superfamily II DNA/RNA helicase
MDKAKVVARIAATSKRTIVFVQTKRNADKVARELRDLGVAAQAIHGDIPQAKRERTLDRITTGKTEVLVSTNVAARGIHIDGLDVVIHWDPPEDARTYLHRSGRTARAGEAGLVVTLSEWNQMHIVRRVQKEAGLNVEIVKMFSNDDRLDNLSNWEPPVPEPDTKPKRTSSRRRSRNRLL